MHENLKKRLQSSRNRFYLNCENSNNIIWLTTIGDLKAILAMGQVKSIVSDLTGLGANVITIKVDELREIRNVIGHNRAVTSQTYQIWKGLKISFDPGINRFKLLLVYTTDEEMHLDNPRNDEVMNYFNSKIQNNDWSKFQPVIGETKYLYYLVSLPVQQNGNYVSISRILKIYQHLDQIILSILVNKLGNEFIISWAKTTTANKDSKTIIDTFLENARNAWTNKNYVEQSPKFICDPKIWFYENQLPLRE